MHPQVTVKRPKRDDGRGRVTKIKVADVGSLSYEKKGRLGENKNEARHLNERGLVERA